MPPTIIAPSVLASDFGQLTAECKRMIKGGAEWLHMGTLLSQRRPSRSPLHRCHGWVTSTPSFPSAADPTSSHFVPNITMGAFPVQLPPLSLAHFSRRTRPFLRVQEHSRHIHGLPYDGRPPRKSNHPSSLIHHHSHLSVGR
jgi:hypothetical protein